MLSANAPLPRVATLKNCESITCVPFFFRLIGEREMAGGRCIPRGSSPDRGRLAERDGAERDLRAAYSDGDFAVERAAARRVVVPGVERDRLTFLGGEIKFDPSLDRSCDAHT